MLLHFELKGLSGLPFRDVEHTESWAYTAVCT